MESAQSIKATDVASSTILRRGRKLDPMRITTLEQAAEYINNAVINNTATMDRIRAMSKHQDNHERQWYRCREAIVEKYRKRRQVGNALQNVLSTLGSNNSTAVETSESKMQNDEVAELQAYDLKVYRASVALVASMSSELSELGIPGFVNAVMCDKLLPGDEALQLRHSVVDLLSSLIAET
ncbi:hypothetical protein V1512DRAFT_260864 [Lipomyces arxii]|uniref:uncharacterized protein n=1 Tax=Lipomyces arxii TaxID=56418 RepID=UPI0034CF1950